MDTEGVACILRLLLIASSQCEEPLEPGFGDMSRSGNDEENALIDEETLHWWL
jgi:hypothetical protein